jgi:hypothetical protein
MKIKPFDLFNMEIKKEEIDKIKKIIESQKIGLDQSSINKPMYNINELLENVIKEAKIEEFEKIAQEDGGGNQLKMIEKLKEQIEEYKSAKETLKILISESRDKGDLNSMVDFMLRSQYAENEIKSLEKRLDVLPDKN